jgi:murein DD-endopeptidase MepM/ murein hydrolase activator NlpD
MSRQSFEEKKNWKFNRFGFIGLIVSLVLFVIVITSVLIAYTPIRELIPGYPDKRTKVAIVENATRLDSLENEIRVRDQYLINFKQVLLGEKPFNTALEMSVNLNDTIMEITDLPKLNMSNTPKKLNHSLHEYHSKGNLPASILFFPPAKGVVTNSFDPAHNHYGTDIVTADDEIVRASLDGTVILANWTMETGYTMQIQHDYNYITIYRHLKKLLHTTGDKVKAGESVGVYGNTGEISFGPHLHFEIWHNGTPLDPEQYIEF